MRKCPIRLACEVFLIVRGSKPFVGGVILDRCPRFYKKQAEQASEQRFSKASVSVPALTSLGDGL